MGDKDSSIVYMLTSLFEIMFYWILAQVENKFPVAAKVKDEEEKKNGEKIDNDNKALLMMTKKDVMSIFNTTGRRIRR